VTLDLMVHDLDLALKLLGVAGSRDRDCARAEHGKAADQIEATLGFGERRSGVHLQPHRGRTPPHHARGLSLGEVKIDFLARTFENTTSFPLNAAFAETRIGSDPLGANVSTFIDAVLGVAPAPGRQWRGSARGFGIGAGGGSRIRPAVALISSRTTMIPFIDLQAQRARIADKIDAAIASVLAHRAPIHFGPEVKTLEGQLAAFGGAKHCIANANGTDALVLPLWAWGVGEGDAVFCPSFTFAATAEIVPWVQATPVFVDVLPGHLQHGPRFARSRDRGREEGRQAEAESRDRCRSLRPTGGLSGHQRDL
jgi:hypothetical protein